MIQRFPLEPRPDRTRKKPEPPPIQYGGSRGTAWLNKAAINMNAALAAQALEDKAKAAAAEVKRIRDEKKAYDDYIDFGEITISPAEKKWKTKSPQR